MSRKATAIWSEIETGPSGIPNHLYFVTDCRLHFAVRAYSDAASYSLLPGSLRRAGSKNVLDISTEQGHLPTAFGVVPFVPALARDILFETQLQD